MVIAAGTALLAGSGIAAFATHVAGAATSAPSGTSLCVPNGLGVVLTPTASGRCLLGQTPVAVANLGGVSGLSTAVNNLEVLTPVRFTGGAPGAGGTSSTYTVPAGVNELRVELWGGGGGGGGGGSSDEFEEAGSGGAQGYYTHSVIEVVPGDTCTVVVGNGGAGGGGTVGADGNNGQPGQASTFSCTQTPQSLTAPGGMGAGNGVPIPSGRTPGLDPAPLEAPSAAFQTYPGQEGGPGHVLPSTDGGQGGGAGFPGTGGKGGALGLSMVGGAGGTGSPGLAVITPVSTT